MASIYHENPSPNDWSEVLGTLTPLLSSLKEIDTAVHEFPKRLDISTLSGTNIRYSYTGDSRVFKILTEAPLSEYHRPGEFSLTIYTPRAGHHYTCQISYAATEQIENKYDLFPEEIGDPTVDFLCLTIISHSSQNQSIIIKSAPDERPRQICVSGSRVKIPGRENQLKSFRYLKTAIEHLSPNVKEAKEGLLKIKPESLEKHTKKIAKIITPSARVRVPNGLEFYF